MNVNDRRSVGAQLNHWLALNVVVAYEDFASGNHALNIVNRLFPGWGQSALCSTQNVWKFDLLEIAKLREVAAVEAARADMVVISAHDPKALPTAVKRWMELWTKKRENNPGALVVLIDGVKKRGSRDYWAESYLQMCAIRAGMDIFIQRRNEESVFAGSKANTGLKNGMLSSPALGKIITGVPWQAGNN
jgi:hypothetical protein